MRTWLITGASSGLGRALAEAVLAGGDNVALGVRRIESVQDLVDQHPDHAIAVTLDVTNNVDIDSAVVEATQAFGGVDVLVNNAGYGYRGAVEEGVDADVRRLFETNFFGPVALVKAVLPGMRERRSGTILNISSIAATIAPAGSGYYAASKAALEGISNAMQKELEPLGIRVVTVEPGGFRTDFGGRSIDQSSVVIDDYAETSGKRRPVEGVNPSLQAPGDPARAAQTLIRLVTAEQVPGFFCMGSDAVAAVTGVLRPRLDDIETHAELSKSSDVV